MQNNQQMDRELGWDETIQQDTTDFILLTPGDYTFEVSKFERARYTPGPNSKLPPCNMAKIELKIQSEQGTAIVFHNLYLHTSTEGMLSAFFSAIGMKKKGEPTQMNWNAVIGAKGACKIKNREYKDNKYNEVQSFYAKDPSYYIGKDTPAIVQQLNQPVAGYQAPPQQYQQPNTQQPQQQQGGYQPGAF